MTSGQPPARTGQFHQLDTATRLGGVAGRIAEDAFERYMEAKGRVLGEKLWRYGFDRLTTRGGVAATFDSWLLHTPDYVQVGGHLWEVEGTKTEFFQFKKEKLVAMTLWESLLGGNRQLRWFLFNSADGTAVVASHATVIWATAHPDTEFRADLFDGKAGWLVPRSVFAERFVAGDPFDAERRVREMTHDAAA